MDTQIKNYADSKDLKSLKYIFVDALDVDPTFVRYEQEYNYCKSIPGLLEPYIELTPFCQDKSRWDEAYWTSLKMDLVKNFSDRRMMHMKEVAQVFLAEKVNRIMKERSADSKQSTSSMPLVMPENKTESVVTATSKTASISRAEQERRELEEAKRKLEEENRRTEAARRAEAKRLEQQRMIHKTSVKNQSMDNSSKKVIGIAVVALAVIVWLILVLK